MKSEAIDLYAQFGMQRSHPAANGTLLTYRTAIGEISPRLRPAVLLIPGGAYAFLSEREGEPVALQFLAHGYNVYLLRYSLSPVRHPAQLTEAAMAMRYIREHADEHGTDAAHVAAIGFSAGGHLCGMLGTCFDDPCLAPVGAASLIRPDAVILGYPVISSEKGVAHAESFINLCGANHTLRASLSLERRISAASSPAFLFHMADDDLVPASNSLLAALAYARAGVPFEVHLFESGRHGCSVCSKEVYEGEDPFFLNPHNAEWMTLAFGWLKQRGFCVKDRFPVS